MNDESDAVSSDLVLFKNEPGEMLIEAMTEDALVIVLSGEPIDEPIIQHGPFVMNTEREIVEAFRDLRIGKFGDPNF